jgi:hypothetical protein
MPRHFGVKKRIEIEPAELTAGALYAIFAVILLVLWLAFIHP